MEISQAYSLISSAVQRGKAASGYLICGDLRSQCMELAQKILKELFPGEEAKIEERCHPDIVFLEPEGKARIITVDAVRERVVEPMSATSFSGGWRVAVVCSADRMRQEAANAFLKTLEEPGEKTMFLLLTDAPEGILPTIASRTQRIDLPLGDGTIECEEVREEIADAFAKRDAKALADKLKELKEEAGDEESSLVRKAFFRTIMSFTRQMMIGGRLEYYQSFRNIEAVEEAYRQCDRSMNEEAVLSFMIDRMVFP
jgi:hypothetical protein